MGKGRTVGDEDREGMRSRSCKTLLAPVRTLSFTPHEEEESEDVIFFSLFKLR